MDFGFTEDIVIQNRKSKIQNGLGGFDDLSRFQAARAYPKALCAAADESADRLQVWIEASVGAVVGVAHAVAKLRPLAADLASF